MIFLIFKTHHKFLHVLGLIHAQKVYKTLKGSTENAYNGQKHLCRRPEPEQELKRTKQELEVGPVVGLVIF